MARAPSPTPENRWNLTEEQIDEVRHEYVTNRCTLQRTAYRTGVKASVVALVCKHHGWTRSAWDRPQHVWTKQAYSAVQERDAKDR